MSKFCYKPVNMTESEFKSWLEMYRFVQQRGYVYARVSFPINKQWTTQTVWSRVAAEHEVPRQSSYTCHPNGFPVHWKPGAHINHNIYIFIHCLHTHIHLFNGPLSGTTRVSQYQKGKTIWILLKQEIVSGSGISWAICKSAPRSRQITTPAPTT